MQVGNEPCYEQNQFSPRDEVDAVVIGTGAGGAPLLARLAQAGLSVVALEAGPQWNPSRDFATDERAQDDLFWNDERLSAGAIETPRLLLMNEMANSSGQVGRNFMAHTGVQLWGQFDHEVRPYKGIPGALISEDTHRPQDADFAGGYLLQSIGVMPVTYASQVARGRGLRGEELREHMRGYNNTAGINIMGDCLPYECNFVELSDEKDARGLPKSRVHFTNGENERRMSTHAETLMRQIWSEAGAKEMWSFPRNAHIIGTCRMGNNAEDNVVNADGRAFDVPNLTICDNSIFPSALAVNPALTIMALSLRTADKHLNGR